MTLEEKLGQLQQLDGEADGRSRPEHLELAAQRPAGLGAQRARRGRTSTRCRRPPWSARGSRSRCSSVTTRSTATAPSSPSRSAKRRASTRRSPKPPRMRPPTRSAAAGVKWTFAPMVDITRDPRWGRVAEGAGEDPVSRQRARRGAGARLPGQRLLAARPGGGHRQALGGLRRRRGRPRLQHDRRHGAGVARVVLPAVQGGAWMRESATFMSAFNDIDGTPAPPTPSRSPPSCAANGSSTASW